MSIDRSLPHTAWYWIEDPNDPMPMPFSVQFDDADEGEAFARKFVSERDDPFQRLRWIRVFRTSNEAYEIYRWENPEPAIYPERPPVEMSYIGDPARWPRGRWWRRNRQPTGGH